MESDILRKKFLQFFQSQGHKILPSDSLIPRDDPTVLFTSAGMNQFKKQFLGQNIAFPRVTTCQKCLRTDDLDKVGRTCGHHTFFEMLGNFSFGDYFKEEAIQWAWEFLVKELKISKEKLWVSVYKDDSQAYNIWKGKIKIPQDKILKLGDKENFWPAEAKQKGPNGPCGPCSEIFFDQGKDIGCGRPDCNPSCGCDRFVEVWNLVFTSFERKEGGVLADLPHKNIDTGMGLERLAAVMQGVFSNFDTDLFVPIIKTIEEISKAKFKDNRESFCAISDHIRAITFAISDGIIPSNEERGYVVRNLIRRSLQHARTLRINKAFLYKLIPAVSSLMKRAYPQLEKKREDIAQIVKAEEDKFIEMLNETLPKFQDIVKALNQEGKQQVPADIVFKFRDTYGLPWDIIETSTSSSGLDIDWPEVEKLLDLQRSRSRGQSKISDSIFIKERTFKGKSLFVRDACEIETVVVDLFKKSKDANEVEVVLENTPFYPQAGGQIGDSGLLINKTTQVAVYDTKRMGDAIVHYGKIEKGEINIGDKVLASIDKKRRLAIARNHTATHLLQAALRQVLGEHVQQQGSLVSEERLRFDFTHFKAIDKPTLDRIEEVVNSYIKNNDVLKIEEMSLDKARESGALAFFGEKYSDKVRVVSVGNYSKELCGGAHLESTGSIGLFKIISEESAASGIRRIEAVTGDFADEKAKGEQEAVIRIAQLLGVPENKINIAIYDLLSRTKELEKKLNLVQLKLLVSSSDNLIKEAQLIDGKRVILKFMEGYDADSLRKTIDLIKEKLPNSIALLMTMVNGKIFLTLGVTDDLVKKGVDASKILKGILPLIGARGAGRPDFAQAGGGEASKIKDIEDGFKKMIKGVR